MAQRRDKKTGRFAPKRKGLGDYIGGRKKGSESTFSFEKMETKRVKLGKTSYNIPVDKNGYVPMEALAARFLDVYSGSKKGKKRNPAIDQSTNASTIIYPDKKGRFKPEDVVQWYARPNEYDIDGLDTIGGSVFKFQGTRKGSAAAQRKIAVIAPTEKDLNAIRLSLDNAFTIAELKNLTEKGGLTISVDPSYKGAGKYNPEVNTITLNPDNVTPGTTIHESIHRLRETDENRKSVISRSRVEQVFDILNPFKNDDRNVEEAATTFETIIRLDPKADPDYVSYYHILPGTNSLKAAKEKVKKDRDMALPAGKPLKGKRAVAAVEKNFENSEIAKLKHANASKTAKSYIQGLKRKS